jgi:ATP-binding cassette subfamily B protein
MKLIKDFLFIIGTKKSSFGIILLIGLVVEGVMTALNPLVLKYMFDEGIIKQNFKLFIIISLSFILLATLMRIFDMFYQIYIQKMKNDISKNMVQNMLSMYYKIPYIKILDKPTGYYLTRVYDEPLNAVNSSIDLILAISYNIIAAVVSIIIVLAISAKVTVYLALAIPFIVILSKKYQHKIKKYSHNEKESEGDLRGVITKGIQSYRTVKIFSLWNAITSKLAIYFDKYNQNIYFRVKNTQKFNTASGILMSYVEILVIILCGYEILKGKMTFGGFMGFMNAFWYAMNNIKGLFSKVSDISKNTAYIERIKDFNNLGRNEMKDEENMMEGEDIYFENVEYNYGTKNVIHNLNFKIQKGNKVLIIGKNGSGKSTIANLLCKFLESSRGRINAPKIDKISALLSPHNFIPGTLEENILSVANNNQAYMRNLLNDFNLNEYLHKNPEDLSAGQKKKAEILMTLMKEGDLYIFDEPLANVDVDSKRVIMEHIFNRVKGKTLILIMHGDEEFQNNFDKVIKI